MYISLKEIRANNPCQDGWKSLLKYLGKQKSDHKPLPFKDIVTACGLEGATWALCCLDDIPEIRLFAARCARQIQHLIKDEGLQRAIDIAELYSIGECSEADLQEAHETSKEYIPLDQVDRDIQSMTITITNFHAKHLAWNVANCAAWTAAHAACRNYRPATGLYREAWLRAYEKAREEQKLDFIEIFCEI